jgi:hypothetical protein
MTIYVSQCECCSHNNQHNQSNQDPNQGFSYLPAPLKFYMPRAMFFRNQNVRNGMLSHMEYCTFTCVLHGALLCEPCHLAFPSYSLHPHSTVFFDLGSISEHGGKGGAGRGFRNCLYCQKCTTSYGNWFGMGYRRMRINAIGTLHKMLHVRCASLKARTAITQPWYARMLKV